MVLPRLTLLALVSCAACSGPEPLRPPHPVETKRDELRPTDTSSTEMWRFLSTDSVERFELPDSGFRVHFTRAGKNTVPALDANTNGTPDLVESVASVYEQVAAKYQGTMGFRAPVGDLALTSNGGSDRFDIYLLDFGLSADGAFRTDQCTAEKCIGYVVQENDFVGYGYPNATVATRILGSHEYFHAIQAAYDDGQGVVISEGTAVWATEQFDPSTNDFEGFLGGFMSRPERSLDSAPPGPVPSFAYGSAIFFQFLSEKYGQPIIRKLWERCENGKGHVSEPADVANPRWMVQLDALLKSDYQSSFAEAFRTFVTWNLYTGMAANPSKSYFNGANYPSPLIVDQAAPYQVSPPPSPDGGPSLRVFYASTQYFRLIAGSRPVMGALLIDDPATPNEDETNGMALVLAARRSNVNSDVVVLADLKTGSQTIDTSGNAQLIVAVVNTTRESVNGVLSKRPGICVGSPEELRACRIAHDPSFDAGVPDAGTPDAGVPDAGVQPDAGPDADAGTTPPPPPPAGCGCNGGGSALGLGLLALLAAARRRTAT